jgi:hypothetical protein
MAAPLATEPVGGVFRVPGKRFETVLAKRGEIDRQVDGAEDAPAEVVLIRSHGARN